MGRICTSGYSNKVTPQVMIFTYNSRVLTIFDNMSYNQCFSFSYSVDLANLKQWHNFTLPVIFVLWDIEQRIGYWVHMQPLITNCLQTSPDWLKNLSQAKKPERKIHIPADQVLRTSDDVEVLNTLIRGEYDKTKLGRQYFEKLPENRLRYSKLNSRPKSETVSPPSQPLQLPPNVEQQLSDSSIYSYSHSGSLKR